MHKNHLGQAIGFPLIDFKTPKKPPARPIIGDYCSIEPLSIQQHAADLFAANSKDTEQRNWTYLPYGPFAT